jgi:membrane-bound serine protease (ClpP class)
MRRLAAFVVLAVAWLGLSVALVAGSSAVAGGPGSRVLELKLDGVVDPFSASYIQRGIEHANAEGDAAVLITIDTPGGLDSSMRTIIKSVLGSRVPVICYTAPSGARAASAGTFIMMACPISAMAPGTNIGAAHPVGVSGAIENEKVTNDAAAFIATLANRWGRNADFGKKAVRTAESVTAETAVRIHAVDFEAPSAAAVVSTVGHCFNGVAPPRWTTGLLRSRSAIPGVCGSSFVPFHMSVTEALFHAFADPNVAFVLLNIGLVALIVWVIHPGLHVSLAVGVIFSVLGFLILETLPVRLGGVILLVIAAVLFVLDVKAKAHGVLTAGGIAVLILGGLLLFNPSVPSAHVSLPLLIALAALVGLFMLFVLRAILSSRYTPLEAGREALAGERGVALTDLAPTGQVRARNETWTATSVGGAVPGGSPVHVLRLEGVRLIVEPIVVEEGAPAGPEPASKGGKP